MVSYLLSEWFTDWTQSESGSFSVCRLLPCIFNLLLTFPKHKRLQWIIHLYMKRFKIINKFSNPCMSRYINFFFQANYYSFNCGTFFSSFLFSVNKVCIIFFQCTMYYIWRSYTSLVNVLKTSIFFPVHMMYMYCSHCSWVAVEGKMVIFILPC